MKPFKLPIRVYYEDTDAGGVVYYANYLKFMERARTEWLRSYGFEQDELRQQGIVFVVRSVTIDYLKPALFNQLLCIETSVKQHGHASITFSQEVLYDGQKLSEASVKLVCVDSTSFRPQAIPTELTEIFTDEIDKIVK